MDAVVVQQLAMMAELGFSVTAVDPSVSGILVAKETYPDVKFSERSAYDDLRSEFGEFDAVVSLEVVEHCYWPRLFAQTVYLCGQTRRISCNFDSVSWLLEESRNSACWKV